MLSSAAEEKHQIIFHILPGLPYAARMLVSGALLCSGVMVQAYGALIPGVVALFAGVLLLTTRGYRNVVRPAKGHSDWRPARAEDVQRILEINAKQRRWDMDAVDISNGLGFFTLVAFALGLGFWSFRMGGLETDMGRLIALDSAAALLPFWVTGIRSVLKNDALIIKTELLLKLYQSHKAEAAKEEEFQFQMQTAPVESGGEMPQDVKAMVRFSGGPADFYGLQVQVAINNVQGSDYPYAYCVLVAKPGFGLQERLRQAGVTPGPGWSSGRTIIVVEAEDSGDAEVMIFRQATEGDGYRTKQWQAQAIFDFALAYARNVARTPA